jgi:hypothetical protein
MLSTSPAEILSDAISTASMPDPHTQLIVVPATPTDKRPEAPPSAPNCDFS